MEPAAVSLQIAGITTGAPHPNAALLFVDYMVSPEGQRIFQQVGYLPADPDVPAHAPALKPEGGHFNGNVLGPEAINAGLDHWTAVFKQLFH
jgi:iron(III) transport system substrate-binding protein